MENGVGIEMEQKLIWSAGEKANVTWRPSSLVPTEVIGSDNLKVDVSLVLYNDKIEKFEEAVVLATNLPNTGFAFIQLPDPKSLPISSYHIHAALVKLSINISTTAIPEMKRAGSKTLFKNILGRITMFTQVRFVTMFESSIERRLLCESWFTQAPPFPQDSIPPCPCTLRDASMDDRYVLESFDGETVNAVADILRQYAFHKQSRTCYRQSNVRYQLSNSSPMMCMLSSVF